MFKISKNYIAIGLYLILSLAIVLLTFKYLPDSKSIFYKGYHAYDSVGNELPIEVTDKCKIRIPLKKTNAEESFTLCFQVSLMHKVLAIFSALSLIIFLGYLVIRSSSARQSS